MPSLVDNLQISCTCTFHKTIPFLRIHPKDTHTCVWGCAHRVLGAAWFTEVRIGKQPRCLSIRESVLKTAMAHPKCVILFRLQKNKAVPYALMWNKLKDKQTKSGEQCVHYTPV